MNRRRHDSFAFKLFLVLVVFVAGVAASVTLTTAHADTVGLGDLGGLGYVLSLQFNVQTGCGMYVVVGGNNAPETVIGDPSHPGCQPVGAIESRIAALVAAYPPVRATSTTLDARTVTVASVETRTVFVTTAAPAVTETRTQVQTETVARTVLAPTTVASVETVERTATSVETVTNTVTVVPSAPVVSLVDAASLSALERVYGATADEGAAALAARSAGLDVVYGLALA